MRKDKTVKDRLNDLEANLIEQEHRPLSAISNFLLRNKKWKNDPRKKRAAVKAFIWILLFSPSSAVLLGSIAGLLSLLILFYQTRLISDQNEKISEQISFQELTFKQARKTDLISNLFSENRSLRQSAFIEFYSDPFYYENTFLQLENIDLENISFEGLNLSKMAPKEFSIKNSEITKPKWDIITDRLILKNNRFENAISFSHVNHGQLIGNRFFDSNISFVHDSIIITNNIALNSKIGISHLISNYQEITNREFKTFCYMNYFIGDTITLPFGDSNQIELNVFINCKVINSSGFEYKSDVYFNGNGSNIYINCVTSNFDSAFQAKIDESKFRITEVIDMDFDPRRFTETIKAEATETKWLSTFWNFNLLLGTVTGYYSDLNSTYYDLVKFQNTKTDSSFYLLFPDLAPNPMLSMNYLLEDKRDSIILEMKIEKGEDIKSKKLIDSLNMVIGAPVFNK